ncbi:hypothetical protein LTR56_019671 [Elasticomyces elasticus]|nr:hypothetical protein LTR56_019671 [Elasticomyces elasticus]KAK3633972.1 hypothetical protein LTR22_019839 [Elasticomyces elasticus]KAK4911133.1 hypothetical protein LTR49_020300 [Elasticomyces elasticus]KAK5750639.1 hypothetical protein LTS12_019260 [Elasticomyces elasticus]
MNPIQLYTLHGLNGIVGCLSVAVLALASTVFYYDSQQYYGVPLPVDIRDATPILLMWAGVHGIIDTITLFFVLRAFRHDVFNTLRARQFHDHLFLYVGLFIAARNLVVLIYVFAVYNGAKHFPLDSRDHSGYLTFETWACGTKGYAQGMCNSLRATRWVLVPLTMFGVALTGMVLWTWLHRKEERLAGDGEGLVIREDGGHDDDN